MPREIIWTTGVWWITGHRASGDIAEQNGLFERVLREVGFTVRSVLGRVVLAIRRDAAAHRLLLVELNGERWIADVGFGGQTLTAPIRLIANEEQKPRTGLSFAERG
ncbi:MAG: arylamine N-acetyltransferase [Enterobacter hormaechei]